MNNNVRAVLLLIAIGTLTGGIVQFIVLQNIANGKFELMTARRKRGQILAGALGGVVAGLIYFSRQPELIMNGQQIIWALLSQLSGGFLGLSVFEFSNVLNELRKRNG